MGCQQRLTIRLKDSTHRKRNVLLVEFSPRFGDVGIGLLLGASKSFLVLPIHEKTAQESFTAPTHKKNGKNNHEKV
jgi:hypothetical protein